MVEKTNVMRLLEQAKISYTPHFYDGAITDGEQIAAVLGEDPDRTYKTLVTVSDHKIPFVFVIPVNRSLDLKKAAASAGVKSLSMLKQKELFGLTGYVHGGCSPIGMKKSFRTFFHSTSKNFSTICFSAGKVGFQVEVEPILAVGYIGAGYAWLTVEDNG